MDENEFFKLIARDIIRSMAESILKSRSISKAYANLTEKEKVEAFLDDAAGDIANRIAARLKESGKELNEQEFGTVVRSVINEYLSELNADGSNP